MASTPATSCWRRSASTGGSVSTKTGRRIGGGDTTQYFAAFAAEVARGLRGHDELAWRERLMADLDNLRTAVVWGLDTGVEEDQQTAVAIVAWLAYEAQTIATTGIGRWA